MSDKDHEIELAEALLAVRDYRLAGLIAKIEDAEAVVKDVTLDTITRENAREEGIGLIIQAQDAQSACLLAFCEYLWLLPEVPEPTRKGG